MRKIIPAVGISAALLILAGCNTVAGAGKDIKSVGQTFTQSSVSKKDSQITQKVLYRLASNKEITPSPASPIRVQTKNGVVTLSGVVKNNYQRKAAVITAKSVKGVVTVKDRLVVR